MVITGVMQYAFARTLGYIMDPGNDLITPNAPAFSPVVRFQLLGVAHVRTSSETETPRASAIFLITRSLGSRSSFSI